MTVQQLKAEIEYYDENANVIFNFGDPDVEVESWTEDKYGYKTVSINCKLEPRFIGECRGDMWIDLGILNKPEEENT